MSDNDQTDRTFHTKEGVDLREVASSLFDLAKDVASLADSLRREAGLLSALCDHLGDYKGDGGDG